MAPRRGGPVLAQGMVSHPYPMAKDTQPLNTTCELCDRTFPTKDWIGHKNGKAHQQREKAEQSKENNKAAAANGDAFGFTVDADFVANGVGGDAGASSSGAWDSTLGDTGASWGDSGLSVSNNFSNGGGTRGGRAQGGGPGACYGCGEVGHNKRDCPSTGASRGCFKCGEQGHNKANCPNPSQGGRRSDSRECFNCYQTGHGKNDCPNEKVLKCRNCDELGHHSKECSKPRDYSHVQCNNCKKFGHTMARCKEPPAEQEAGGGWDTAADTTSGAVGGSWEGDNATSSGDWANAVESAADQCGTTGDDGAQW